MPPRILHLFANFKWTGPADPAIRTAHHLRRLGADVVFAEADWIIPGAKHWMRPQLLRWRLPVIAGLELRKHFHPLSLRRDVRRLRARLRRGDFDVLHCHLPGDHLLAALARRGVRHPVTLVRSLYDPEPPRRTVRSRRSFAATDGVVAPTRRCAEMVARRFGLAPERVLYQEPTTEPRPAGDSRTADRARLGLSDEHLVVGITARIQPHRRFELLWEVARQVVDREPRARFVLLGRGNAADTEQLVRGPVKALGLEQHVVLPGYLAEPRYTGALRALDVFLFLVPGSDGTCRAVREAMAQGLPVVATRRGMLPEIIAADAAGDEACGFGCAETAEDLAAAVSRLLADHELRATMGAASRARATAHMDPERAARRLLAFYASLRAAAATEA